VTHAASTGARIRVRQATLADAPRIAELRIALLQEHRKNAIYARLRRDAPARALSLTKDQLAAEGQVMFVAATDDTIVAVLRCIDQRGHRLLRPSRYALISTVYVDPTVRRQGVLRSLMDAAAEWSRARGLTEMRLQNAVDNPLALAAWNALGFEVVEQIRIRPL
jgi:ribosomal protein S18 acetylase RimI-like enzyme